MHDTTPATAIAPKKPKLGVDICDGCGRPPEIVGDLNTNPKYPGVCRLCGHSLDRFDILEDELVDLMRAWYAASLERGFRPGEIEDIALQAADRLAEESRAKNPHPPVPA